MNKYIARIDSETRRVLEFLSGPDFMVPVELPGTLLLTTNVPYDEDTAWIDAELTPHQMPAAPSQYHSWNWGTKAWEVSGKELSKAKAKARAAWNTWRDEKFAEGCLVNGELYHADESFITELLLIMRGFDTGVLPADSTVRLRLKDNTSVEKTQIEVQEILLTIGLARQATYGQSWAGKDALNDQTLTLEHVLAMGPSSTV